MQLVDRDVVKSQALIIDSNPTTRSVLYQNLREFGFGSVKAVGKIADARDILEHRRFDLVVCDDNFEHSTGSGQDLLEELRREQILPYSTVFVMVTGDATYQRVAEAAEAALDSYLIKPFSANSLFERVKEARKRKRELKDIFEAMEAGDNDRAAQLCIERFEAREIYWLYAARIGAELLLTLKRNDEAKQLFDAVVAAKAVPWARLGVARVQLAEGDVSQARRTIESLLGDQPHYADSYDVMGKLQMEQGQLDEALATYRTAAAITPGCILRLQHCGTLSFYAGDSANAIQMLERTWSLGHKSRLFDVLSMMLLAFLRFDARDAKGLGLACDALNRFVGNHPKSVRLKRMVRHGQIMTALLAGQTAHGVLLAREDVPEVLLPDFDMEAATNTLSLWSRLDMAGVDAPELAEVVRGIGQRFSVSKAANEVLSASVRRHQQAPEWVREAHVEVMKIAEAAMNHAMNGEPKLAVQKLLKQGADTGNAKLIEMAGLVARRHAERIDDAQALINSATMLADRFCAPATHVAGVRRSNRSAGGLVLRR